MTLATRQIATTIRISAALVAFLGLVVSWHSSIARADDLEAAAEKRRQDLIVYLEDTIATLEQQRLRAAKNRDAATARDCASKIAIAKNQLKSTRKAPLDTFRQAERDERDKKAAARAAEAKAIAARQAVSAKEQSFFDAGEKSGCLLGFSAPEALFLSHVLHPHPEAPHVHNNFIPPRGGFFSPGAYVRSRFVNRSADKMITAYEVRADLLDAFGEVLTSTTKQGVDLAPGQEVNVQLDLPHRGEGAIVTVSVERLAYSDGTNWQRGPEHRGVMRIVRKTRGEERNATDIEDVLPRKVAPRGGDGNPDPAAARKQDRLNAGALLRVGETLVSKNGKYDLRIAANGIIELRRTQGGQVLWTAPAAGSRATQLKVQDDGNVVLRTDDGDVVWSTNTAGIKEAIFVVQEDGNLVLYAAGERAVWASNTNE